MPSAPQPERIPTELRNCVMELCRHFFLKDVIWRAAFDAIRKHGNSPYYSDKNYKAVAAGLVSVIVEEGIHHGWYKDLRVKNVDLADYLHLNPATIVVHRKHWKNIIRKYGKHSH